MSLWTGAAAGHLTGWLQRVSWVCPLTSGWAQFQWPCKTSAPQSLGLSEPAPPPGKENNKGCFFFKDVQRSESPFHFRCIPAMPGQMLPTMSISSWLPPPAQPGKMSSGLDWPLTEPQMGVGRGGVGLAKEQKKGRVSFQGFSSLADTG